MLDNKWFDGADRKFCFMYFLNDAELYKFDVKCVGKEVFYRAHVNGVEKFSKEFWVNQDKCPNLPFRFYLIIMILAKEFVKVDLALCQLVLDSGFEDERKDLIAQKKDEIIDELAVASVEKDRKFKSENMKVLKDLNKI